MGTTVFRNWSSIEGERCQWQQLNNCSGELVTVSVRPVRVVVAQILIISVLWKEPEREIRPQPFT